MPTGLPTFSSIHTSINKPPSSIQKVHNEQSAPHHTHNAEQNANHTVTTTFPTSTAPEPLHNGQDRIDILLDNLRSSPTDPSSLSFEDIVVSWFKDLLLGDNQANDQTGVDNRILQAYGYTL